MEWRPSPGLRVIYLILIPGLVAAACWFFAAALTQSGVWTALAIFVVGLMFLWSAWAVLGALLSSVRIEGDDLVAVNWPGTVCRIRLAAVARVTPGRYGLEITTADGPSFRAVAVRDIWDRSAREETRAARIAREIESAAGAARAAPEIASAAGAARAAQEVESAAGTGRTAQEIASVAGRAAMPGPRPERPPGLSPAWLVERLGGAGPGSALLIRPIPGAEANLALIATAVALVPWLLVARWLWTGDWPLWQWMPAVAVAVVLTVVACLAWWRVPRSEAWLLRSGRLEIGSVHIRDRSWIRPPAAVTRLELAERVGANDESRSVLVALTRRDGRSRRRELAAADPALLGSWPAGRAGLPLTMGAEDPVVRKARARSVPQAPSGWIAEPFPHTDGADEPGVLLRRPTGRLSAVVFTALGAAFVAVAVWAFLATGGVLFRVVFGAFFLLFGLGVAVGGWQEALRPETWRLRPGGLDVGRIRARDRRWIKPPAAVTSLEVVPDTGDVKARLIGVTDIGERVVLREDREDFDPGSCLRIGTWLADRCGLPLDDHTVDKATPD